MDRIAIRGGAQLNGTIPIGGAKNSAIKLMAASLLTDQPLRLTNTAESYDVDASIIGGGVAGQAGALRMGIARSLAELDPERPTALFCNGPQCPATADAVGQSARITTDAYPGKAFAGKLVYLASRMGRRSATTNRMARGTTSMQPSPMGGAPRPGTGASDGAGMGSGGIGPAPEGALAGRTRGSGGL